jgi:hypothetical protein
MIWIPEEIILETFRAVQSARTGFDQEYNDNLLAFALSNREWTGIAQAELFRSVILNLKNRCKMNRFLKAVRGSEKLRGFSNDVTFLV